MAMTTIPAERRERIAALDYDYAAQPREWVTACNLCGASTFVVLTHRDRYGFDAQAHACERCGLVFINPRMTPAAYGRFYDGIYRPLVSAFHGRRIDAKTIQAEQREYAAERAAFVRPFFEKAALRTMLDIGGSTGVVAHHFAREFALAGTLIDPAPLEVEEARRVGLTTVTGLVEEHDFGTQRFDLVLICQTVDHLLDVGSVLRRVRSLLSDNGLFFIDIVDFRAAYLRNWSVEDAIKIDHPYYLTQETMTAYLRQSGFDILRSDFAADHLHVSYLCQGGAADPAARPPATAVAELFREVRFVQNAPGRR
jgi:2-polyprenyl-3-methyl-5-hydroxy-6-metoxy-1,4-benzoquinol methylase